MINCLCLFLLSTGFLLVLGLFFQPRWLLAAMGSIVPGVIYFAQTDQPIIALTIDDGPDAATTAKILAVLQEHQAQATFFVISSRIKGNETLLQAMLDGGHEIGNHMTEDEPSIQLSAKAFEVELLKAHDILLQFAPSHWLRPAAGWCDRKMVQIAHQHAYQVALGSIFPFDTHIASSWFATNQILVNARPGAVIILHDHGAWGERTAATLTKVLPELSRRGYRIVTLSELFAGDQQLKLTTESHQLHCH